MKNVFRFLGVTALVAVTVFTMTVFGCGDNPGGGGGGGGDPLNGTYKAASGRSYTLTNGSFVYSRSDNPSVKGTYTSAAGSDSASVSMTVKEMYGDYLESMRNWSNYITISLDSKWYTKDQAIAAFRAQIEGTGLTDYAINNIINTLTNIYDSIKTATIDGDTMTVDGTTFIKVPDTTGTGTTWTAVADTKFGTSNITAIAYGGGTFVAGGYDGKMATSTDGKNWTPVQNSTFGTSDIEAIAYGGNRFVAVGEDRKTAWSTDGRNWTPVTANAFTGLGTQTTIDYIAYGNGTFVAASAYGGTVAYSSDNGASWTAVSNPLSGIMQSLASGGGKFLLGGPGYQSNKMAYSTDGTSWTAIPGPFDNSCYIHAIAYGNNIFVAGSSQAANKMAYSANGTSWTTVDVPYNPNKNPYSFSGKTIAFGGGRFVADSGAAGTRASKDGKSWTDLGKIPNIVTVFDIAYGSGKFVAVGNDGTGKNPRMAYLSD